jgi:hypothetical protein
MATRNAVLRQPAEVRMGTLGDSTEVRKWACMAGVTLSPPTLVEWVPRPENAMGAVAGSVTKSRLHICDVQSCRTSAASETARLSLPPPRSPAAAPCRATAPGRGGGSGRRCLFQGRQSEMATARQCWSPDPKRFSLLICPITGQGLPAKSAVLGVLRQLDRARPFRGLRAKAVNCSFPGRVSTLVPPPGPNSFHVQAMSRKARHEI